MRKTPRWAKDGFAEIVGRMRQPPKEPGPPKPEPPASATQGQAKVGGKSIPDVLLAPLQPHGGRARLPARPWGSATVRGLGWAAVVVGTIAAMWLWGWPGAPDRQTWWAVTLGAFLLWRFAHACWEWRLGSVERTEAQQAAKARKAEERLADREKAKKRKAGKEHRKDSESSDDDADRAPPRSPA